MSTYIHLMPTPKFTGETNSISISVAVAQGVFRLTTGDGIVLFELFQDGGPTLSRTCRHVLEGSMTPYEPYYGIPKAVMDEFVSKWKNDPEKIARGLLLLNIHDRGSDNIENGPDLNVGKITEFTPFPDQLPGFSVKLALVVE